MWISIVHELFTSHDTFGDAWHTVIKNTHPTKFSYKFEPYKTDLEKLLHLMKSANFSETGLPRAILNQLCQWNVRPFIWQIEHLSFDATSQKWDCLKILDKAK